MQYRKILYQGQVKLVPADIAEHLVISNQAKYAPAEPIDEMVSENVDVLPESEQNEVDEIKVDVLSEQMDDVDKISPEPIDEMVSENVDVLPESEQNEVDEIKPKKRGRQSKKK